MKNTTLMLPYRDNSFERWQDLLRTIWSQRLIDGIISAYETREVEPGSVLLDEVAESVEGEDEYEGEEYEGEDTDFSVDLMALVRQGKAPACYKAMGKALPEGYELVPLEGLACGIVKVEGLHLNRSLVGIVEFFRGRVEALDEKLADALIKAIEPFYGPAKKQSLIGFVVENHGNLSIEFQHVKWEKAEQANYPTLEERDFVKLGKLCVEAAPSGRLAILHGPPGTGKTHLLRGLVSQFGGDASFVVLSPELAAAATGPSLLRLLLAHQHTGKPVILLIEDADSLLRERATSDRVGFQALSTLLNASDGMIGAVCDLRIICTMNTDDEKLTGVDKAVLRRGRCAATPWIGPFNNKQAMAWLENRGLNFPWKSRGLGEALTLSDLYAKLNDKEEEGAS